MEPSISCQERGAASDAGAGAYQVVEVIECTCTFEAGTEAFAPVEEATCEQMVNTSTK